MDNIIIKVENGNVDKSLQKEILDTFVKRIENVKNDSFVATIVINPNLTNRQVELLTGNAKRYIIDSDYLVDEETRIRLATLKVNNRDISLLYIFEKVVKPLYVPEVVSLHHQDSYMPLYLKEEIKFVSQLVNYQKVYREKLYNTFCVCGDFGSGKTHLVQEIANSTHSTLWKLSYDDIDAENTGSISKKTDAFFKKVQSGDFVLIENADSFLCGREINRFVKNTLVSVLDKKKDFFVFIETTDPSLFDNDIKKNIFRYIYIKPLVEEERKKFLFFFLNTYGICVDESNLDAIQTTGFSVKDLKDVSYIAQVLSKSDSSINQVLSRAIDEVQESKLHSSITSDAPFVAQKPKYKLNDLILPIEKGETIRYAASLLSNIPLVYDAWHFSKIDPHPRAVINFYGKPGTGKTMCAHAIADYLGKDLLALNYAEIESKYIGDAPKKLESAFAYARQHDTVMFFDEADSFLGKRIEDVSHSADQALNSLRSTMLIQLEIFEGVVIFASNLRENYDKAFKSRFLYEIEFELPDLECRTKMIEAYAQKILPISNAKYSDEQIRLLANNSDGLSGREIKTVVLEALNQYAYLNHVESPEDASLPFEILLNCVDEKVKNLNSKITIKTDLDEDKEIIGASLAKQYGGEQESREKDKEKYLSLISLAYCAAWADGVLNEKELGIIQVAAKDLGVKTEMDYTIQENLPNMDELLPKMVNFGLEDQAIELCCRIIASDGVYSSREVDFIHNICVNFKKDNAYVTNVDELISIIAKENVIINKLNNSELC